MEEGLSPVEPIVLKSLRDHVYEQVRGAIVAGRMPSGDKLNERRLAARLGISTTPLKEALRRLEAEGLVRSEPRRGVYVTFDAGQAEEMMLARAAIESMIARQAARRATPGQIDRLNAVLEEMRSGLAAADIHQLIELNERFHEAIHDMSGCDYLRRLQSGQNIYDRATRLSILADRLEQRLAFDEHQAIAGAIATREADVAERLMRDHVLRSGEKHLDRLSKAGK